MKKTMILPILVMVILAAAGTTRAQTSPDAAVIKATLLTQFPNPARAGDIVEFRVVMTNIGAADAQDVHAIVDPKYPFIPIPDEIYDKRIDLLPRYPQEASSKTLIYRFMIDKNAIDGLHDLNLRYSVGNSPYSGSSAINIDVTSKDFAQIIFIDKTKIIPGAETPLTFTVNNIGKAPLTNMIFSWKEKDNVILPVSTDNTRYIPFLDVNQSTQVRYSVIANPTAARGLYTLDLTLTFDTRNASGAATNEKLDTHAGILVGGETDFDVSFAESDSGKTSLSIANTGQNDASSVTVTIADQPNFSVRGGSSSILGNLNKGDFTLATFQIVPKNAPARQQEAAPPRQETKELIVQLSYTDSFGERHTVEKKLQVQTDSLFGALMPPSANGQSTNGRAATSRGFPILWLAVVAIIIVAVVFLYRRRRKVAASK